MCCKSFGAKKGNSQIVDEVSERIKSSARSIYAYIDNSPILLIMKIIFDRIPLTIYFLPRMDQNVLR